jgi:hypothetical protein
MEGRAFPNELPPRNSKTAGGYVPFQKIAEYLAHAEKCSLQSDLTNDAASKLQWSAIAQSWLLLADNLVKKDQLGKPLPI